MNRKHSLAWAHAGLACAIELAQRRACQRRPTVSQLRPPVSGGPLFFPSTSRYFCARGELARSSVRMGPEAYRGVFEQFARERTHILAHVSCGAICAPRGITCCACGGMVRRAS